MGSLPNRRQIAAEAAVPDVLSTSRVTVVLGLVVLVVGGVAGALARYKDTVDPCGSGDGVHVQQLDEDDPADPDFDQVDYGDRSDRERTVFEEIVTAETTPLFRNRSVLRDLERTVVSDRGDRYEIGPVFVSDYFAGWERYRSLGGLAAAVGGSIAVAAYGWRKRRGRTTRGS